MTAMARHPRCWPCLAALALLPWVAPSFAETVVTTFDELAAAVADDTVTDITLGAERIAFESMLTIDDGAKTVGCGLARCVVDGAGSTKLFKVTGAGTQLQMQDVTLEGGFSSSGLTGGGAAVSVEDGAVGTFFSLAFSNNTVFNELYGGAVGVFGGGAANFTSCSFKFSSSEHGSDSFGGAAAVWDTGSVAHFDACTFEHNFALAGGAASVGYGALVHFANTSFTENSAMGSDSGAGLGGGALHIYAGNVTVDGCAFTSNGAAAVDFTSGFRWAVPGAAVWAGLPGDLLFRDTTFTTNSAVDPTVPSWSSSGGAVYVEQNTAVACGAALFDACDFIDNTAVGGGAAVVQDSYWAGQPVVFQSCRFVGNNGTSSGGAISGANFQMDTCTFDGNLASEDRSVHCYDTNHSLDDDAASYADTCPPAFVHDDDTAGVPAVPAGWGAATGTEPATVQEEFCFVPGLHRGVCVGTNTDGLCTHLLPRRVKAFSPQNTTDGAVLPLLSFTHGDMGGGVFLSAYDALLQAIAEQGVVVLAHASCNPSCGDSQYEDQLQVLDWAAAQNARHAHATAGPASVWTCQALSKVDFHTPFAVAGHSTGGRSTLQSAALAAAHNIGAAVGLHPDPEDAAANASTPTLIITGTDDKVEPEGSAKADYDLLPDTLIRGFAEFVNATHMTPVDADPFSYANYTAAWIRAHVLDNDTAAWALIYGDDPSALCGGGHPTEECLLEQPNSP